MASDFNVREILEHGLLLYIVKGTGYFKTTTQNTQAELRETFPGGLPWWPSHPDSPDLNPIQLIWHELKHHLGVRIKSRTKEQLVQGIQGFWTKRDCG